MPPTGARPRPKPRARPAASSNTAIESSATLSGSAEASPLLNGSEFASSPSLSPRKRQKSANVPKLMESEVIDLLSSSSSKLCDELQGTSKLNEASTSFHHGLSSTSSSSSAASRPAAPQLSTFVPLNTASSSRISPVRTAVPAPAPAHAPVANGLAGPSTLAQERVAREVAANTARDQDNDDFFTRRRKSKPPPVLSNGEEVQAEGEESDGSDGGNTTDSSRGSDGLGRRGRPRNHHRHRKQSGPSLPSWAKTDSANWKRSHFSEDEKDEEEEEGFSFSQEVTFTGSNKQRKTSAQKARKTRSPSLTPPPDPDRQIIEQARRIVTQRMAHETRPQLVSDGDDDFEMSVNANKVPADPVAGTPEGGSVARDLPNVEVVEALDPELALLYRGARAEEVRKRAVERQRRRDVEEEQKRKREEEIRRARFLEEQAKQAIVLGNSDDDDDVQPFASGPATAGAAQASPAPSKSDDDSIEFVPAPPTRRSARTTRASAATASSTPVASSSARPARGAKAGTRSSAANSQQAALKPPTPPPAPAPVPAPAPTVEEDDAERINITLRGGTAGQLEMNVRPRLTTTMAKLLDLALNSWSEHVPPGAKAKARIVYDGESLSRTSTIEDAGVEDEEYLEVRW